MPKTFAIIVHLRPFSKYIMPLLRNIYYSLQQCNPRIHNNEINIISS